MSAIVTAVQALASAQATYPESLQGQQEHFARTLPSAREALLRAICDELSAAERSALAEVLADLVDPDDEEDAQPRDADWPDTLEEIRQWEAEQRRGR